MSKSKKKKETKAVIAGQIAFWVSFRRICHCLRAEEAD